MDLTNYDKVADAIIRLVYRVLNRPDAPVANVYLYVFQNVNASDNNLSDIVDLRGNLITGVPRINDQASLFAYNQGATLLCIRGPGVPVTIIGRVVGDIRNVFSS